MLYCYHITPIDSWAGAMTAQAILASLPPIDERHSLIPAEQRIADMKQRLADLEQSAKAAFVELGWRGDTSSGPYFFALPDRGALSLGLMLKQEHSGSTFVASPHPLPWLEALAVSGPPEIHH